MLLFYVFFLVFQMNTPAQLNDLNARITAAFLCGGCVMVTMTAAMMKMNPTLHALVCLKCRCYGTLNAPS